MTPRLKTAIEDLRDCAMTDGNNNPLVPRALLLATENLLAAYDAEMSEEKTMTEADKARAAIEKEIERLDLAIYDGGRGYDEPEAFKKGVEFGSYCERKRLADMAGQGFDKKAAIEQAKHEDSDGYFGFLTGAEWQHQKTATPLLALIKLWEERNQENVAELDELKAKLVECE